MSIRTERVGEEMRRVLSERLLRGLREPLPGFVTVVRVEVTSDFTHAKVWISVIGTDADKAGAIHILTQERGQLRFEVGQQVRLRHTPELQFKLDDSGEKASRVWQILDEERAKNPGAAAPPVAPPGKQRLTATRELNQPQPDAAFAVVERLIATRGPRPDAVASLPSPGFTRARKKGKRG